ncbi:hypothetical protein LPJ57_011494, partial [Coemansia sp. RSA 486]
MPLFSETLDAASQPSAQSHREVGIPGPTTGDNNNSNNNNNSNAQNTASAVHYLSDMLRSTELDWQSCPSDSGSDT